MKQLSNASTSLGFGKDEKHKTLSMTLRNLSYSLKNKTKTHKSVGEYKGESVLCSQTVRQLLLWIYQEREPSLCTEAVWGDYEAGEPGMSLNGFRIECRQTRNIGKEVLLGEERKIKDSDLRLNEVCWCNVHRHCRGLSLTD